MGKIIRPEIPINNDFREDPKKNPKGKNYIFANITEYIKAQARNPP